MYFASQPVRYWQIRMEPVNKSFTRLRLLTSHLIYLIYLKLLVNLRGIKIGAYKSLEAYNFFLSGHVQIYLYTIKLKITLVLYLSNHLYCQVSTKDKTCMTYGLTFINQAGSFLQIAHACRKVSLMRIGNLCERNYLKGRNFCRKKISQILLFDSNLWKLKSRKNIFP